MVFVSKKQRQNLINFLNDANLHTFFYFLKNPLAYYNILTFRGPDICYWGVPVPVGLSGSNIFVTLILACYP